MAAILFALAAPPAALIGCGKRGGPPEPPASSGAASAPGSAEVRKPMPAGPAAPSPQTSAPRKVATMIEDDPALAALYELEASVPGRWDGVDLIPLESDEPVPLEAALVRKPGALSGDEAQIQIRWTAESGRIEAQPGGPDQGVALWFPPADSRPVRVSAEAIITLRADGAGRGAASGAHPAGDLVKSVAFTFLSPLLGSGLKAGLLDGFNIGEYPDPAHPPADNTSPWPKLHPERYAPPHLFYQVTQATKPNLISPSLTLGHFAIDYPWGSLGLPQYVAIDMNLVEKLEDLIQLMRADGHKVATLTPIYGFRAPSFNFQSILNRPETNLKEEFSMHQYGRAMDFIIDEDGDLVMDDLNGDGKHDIHDAAVIMHYVNLLDRRYRDEKKMEKLGGAGLYEYHDFEGRKQSPYIHVDTRGFQSQSNTLIRWKKPDPPNWPDGTAIQWGKI